MDNKKPVLVAMAAGMSSRFGAPKQLTPVDGEGRCLVEYACADARRAGFDTVVFILRREHEQAFREGIGARVSRGMQVRYAFQSLDHLPESFSLPQGRVKPWGTAHAVLSACEAIGGAPALVINADDYYGREPYRLMYRFLLEQSSASVLAMAGYRLCDTLSDSGGVTRGICTVKDGDLIGIEETRGILRRADGSIAPVNGEGPFLPEDATVSMNMWGFGADFLPRMQILFEEFLRDEVPADPMESECLLPGVVGRFIRDGSARVRVLPVREKWYGITYAEDLPVLKKALAELGAWSG